jgi:hypothetical protein
MKIIPGKEKPFNVHEVNAKIGRSLVTLCLIIFAYFVYTQYSEWVATQNTLRKNAICPPLLSVGRSARDTLIVMKAEPLCNSYILENFQ